MADQIGAGAEPLGAAPAPPLGLLLSLMSAQRAFAGASDAKAVEGTAAKLRGAIDARGGPDGGHEFRLSPGLVALVGPPREGNLGGGERRPITGFSQSSRRRMLRTLGTLDLASVVGIPVFVTLTYPGDWRPLCRSGREAKNQLNNFRRRWQRRWGDFPAVWKLEFQPRKNRPPLQRMAPHFHILATLPAIDPLGKIPTPTNLTTAREWVSKAWREVIGSGDERHLRAGTQVLEADGSTPGRLIGYFAGYTAGKSKEEQHLAPPNWPGLGRFWGVWGIPRIEIGIEISEAEFIQLRRVLADLMVRRSGGRRRKFSRRSDGLWVGIENAPQLAARLAAWLAGEYPPRVLP
ncbi:MAG: rolling circle replication-associated protein [Acidimicrobiales bacterium]